MLTTYPPTSETNTIAFVSTTESIVTYTYYLHWRGGIGLHLLQTIGVKLVVCNIFRNFGNFGLF